MTDQQSSPVVESLSELLASSYLLYVKTHNYHWNVTGPKFTFLHTLFEEQYTELAMAVDVIAERIRAVGAFAPGSLGAFTELASIEEERGQPDATQMIKNLTADQDVVAAAAQKVVDAAEEAGDVASADLATQRITVHQKNAWMLRSHLE
jgi:starvation-inducible DNA-binding protein